MSLLELWTGCQMAQTSKKQTSVTKRWSDSYASVQTAASTFASRIVICY